MNTKRVLVPLTLWLICISAALAQPPPLPEWIWHEYRGALPEKTEVIHFRKEFVLPAGFTAAELKVCGDDEATVFLNGKQVMVAGRKADPGAAHYSATAQDVTARLRPGGNLVAARLKNGGGPFGLIARLEVTRADGTRQYLISDTTWLTSLTGADGWEQPGHAAKDWMPARKIGTEGDNPWFEVMTPPTTARRLELPPGFESELIREVRRDELGSWITMTVDDRGRLIVSPQKLESTNRGGLLRFTLGPDGRIVKEEKLNVPVGGAQGLVYAHGALYVNGYAGTYTADTLGFYRVRDTDGDDQLDSVELLKQLHNRGGSHGPHGLALGPDGMIYHISGDYSKLVDGIAPDSPHKNYQEDLLLPRIWDPSGHARGVTAPCGHVQRTDKDGKRWELVAAGFRNPYDLAFNADGELFTYDADMEYDTGLPWYRATRVYQVVSGGEYGQRAGSGKWPYHYPDSLPPATDIGLGSPCGIKFGTGSHFPPRYQKALFLSDWAWGNVYAVHLSEQGAGYTATFEKFAVGRPLNAMDIEFGRDGAMYLLTGGNDTQTGLYRISYRGASSHAAAVAGEQNRSAAAARALRRKVESFHGRRDAAAVDFVWPHLDSPDRWIRYASRIALEWQPVSQWRDRALRETRPRAALTALLALARNGDATVKSDLLTALLRLAPAALPENLQLELLRVYGVAFSRMGGPGPDLRQRIIRAIAPRYPAGGDALNRELCQLLVFLEDPGVIGKSLKLVTTAATQEQQIWYVHCLRNAVYGWTPARRAAHFRWFADEATKFRGGVSFHKFLAQIKRDAAATVPPAERPGLAALLGEFEAPAAAARPAVPRAFVKEWRLAELEPVLPQVESGRSFTKGRAAFQELCLNCHRLGLEGGLVGPDLTGVANRFSRRDILEAIVAPSKIVMEQYQNSKVVRKSGDVETGRLIEDTPSKVVLVTNPLTLERVEIPRADVRAISPAELSPMPEGLVNSLSAEEILDLLAYVESGGVATYSAFRKK